MAARDLVNVLDPALVAATSIGGQTDQLDASLGELGLELGKGAKLGGADGGEVFRVREENNPTVADELVEVDGTFGGLGLEVRGNRAQAEATSTCEPDGQLKSSV